MDILKMVLVASADTTIEGKSYNKGQEVDFEHRNAACVEFVDKVEKKERELKSVSEKYSKPSEVKKKIKSRGRPRKRD